MSRIKVIAEFDYQYKGTNELNIDRARDHWFNSIESLIEDYTINHDSLVVTLEEYED